MCGRFALMTMPEALADYFELSEIPRSLTPRYNIAPTQPIATIRVRKEGQHAGERELEMFHWGLIPFWAKDPSIGNRMINARAESAPEKPAFRHAFRRRRCLIPADGFFEWKKLTPEEAEARGIRGRSPKQPMLIRRRDGRPFAFAGLWEYWADKEETGEEILSCTILTTTPNELCQPIHDRMPVILDPGDFDAWLDPSNEDVPSLTELLRPAPSSDLEHYPVSRRVNRPQNDDPSVVERIETGGLFD